MGTCVRQEGWERRLAETIEKARTKRFKWGKHDCSLLSLQCIDAMCMTETIADWHGKYRNEEEAYALLESKGGYDVVYQGYGLEKKAPPYAMRGDVAYIGKEKAIGVVMGEDVITTGLKGIEVVPILMVETVWSVPCHQ